jgi:hypothetical protein
MTAFNSSSAHWLRVSKSMGLRLVKGEGDGQFGNFWGGVDLEDEEGTTDEHGGTRIVRGSRKRLRLTRLFWGGAGRKKRVIEEPRRR